MDELLATLVAIWFWRVVLTTTIAIAIAVTLHWFLPSFTAVAGIVLACAGIGFGLLWQSSTKECAQDSVASDVEDISWPVATLALPFFGAIAGSLAAGAVGSIPGGATLLLVGVASIGIYRARVVRRAIRFRSLVIATLLMLIGYGSLAVVGTLSK